MSEDFLIRLLLLPLSLLYGFGVSLRKLFYRIGVLKSISFDLPVISVGNLTVGGAGKTPHLEYLIKWLDQHLEVATLSRGYGRKTAGFRPVSIIDTAEEAGDEPLGFKRKFPHVAVAVGENRSLAVPELVRRNPETQVVLLDDAFQHMAVTPGLNVLLTEFSRPFFNDWLLPSGRLREWRSGYRRADMIVVTKCPDAVSEAEKQRFLQKIKPFPWQTVFFSRYRYADPFDLLRPDVRKKLDLETDVILISAIAGTRYLLDFLAKTVRSVVPIEHEDHHFFEEGDLEALARRFENAPRKMDAIILTTEKDAVRLEAHRDFLFQKQLPVFVLPIEVEWLEGDETRFQREVREWLLDFKR